MSLWQRPEVTERARRDQAILYAESGLSLVRYIFLHSPTRLIGFWISNEKCSVADMPFLIFKEPLDCDRVFVQRDVTQFRRKIGSKIIVTLSGASLEQM